MKKIFILHCLICSLCLPLFAQQFRIMRPVPDTVQNNGDYLYGEPNFQNPLLAHTGLDISIRYDTVKSASNGMVISVGYNPNDTVGGYEPGGAGNYIIVRSIWENKLVYFNYYHLKKPLKSLYDSVKTGMPIAISGNTGNSTGPHLHFEIRMYYSGYSYTRTRRNPELWFGMTGTGTIYGRVPNAVNSTRVDINPDPKPRPPYTTFSYGLTYNFNDTYIGSDDIYNENYAFGDVKPGTYIITANSGAYRRVVTVAAGQVVNADAAVNVDEQTIVSVDNYLTAYPNPFTSFVTIRLDAENQSPRGEPSKLIIYDLLGKEVREIPEVKVNDKITEYIFNSDGLAAGVYFGRIIRGEKTRVVKLLKIR